MIFKVHATGSTGNLYSVNDDLLIDCGLPVSKIKKLLNFKLSSFKDCLVSHAHSDHCKAVKDLIELGITCHMTQDTADHIGLDKNAVSIYRNMSIFKAGRYMIKPFDTVHNITGGSGYLISDTKSGRKLLFCTDSASIEYLFNDVDILAIECNYDESIDKNPLIDEDAAFNVAMNHAGINDVRLFFEDNPINPAEIHLLHTSSRGNIDKKSVCEEIKALTGKPVYIY